MSDPTSYLLERGWVEGRVQDDVLVEIEDGRFVRVEVGGSADGSESLAGLTIPGLADCHSKPVYHLLRNGYYPTFGPENDGLGFAPMMVKPTRDSSRPHLLAPRARLVPTSASTRR